MFFFFFLLTRDTLCPETTIYTLLQNGGYWTMTTGNIDQLKRSYPDLETPYDPVFWEPIFSVRRESLSEDAP